MVWATFEITVLVYFVSSVLAAEPLSRHPAPITSRRAAPYIPSSFNVARAAITPRSLAFGERDAGTGTRRRSIADIRNVLYSRQSYNVFVEVGQIPFELALDSGSSDTWILSDRCSTPQCTHNPRYPLTTYASPSFTSVDNNQTAFNISFADTTGASGFVARETLKLGNVEVVGQGIGMVTSSNLTLGENVSGLLGLGFPRLSRIAASTENAEPFLSVLSQNGQLSYPLFGLHLTTDGNGTLSMGAIDRSVISNASLITWHDVVPFLPLPGENSTSIYLHWAIPLNGISINGTGDVVPSRVLLHPTYENITGANPLALLDVGFAGILGPLEDVSNIFTAMGTVRQAAPGVWVLPCDTQATMTFSFAGTNVTLQPRDYLIGPTAGDPSLCLSWPVASPPGADGLDWHLGMPFLRAVYTVFSYGIAGKEPPLIGLYPLSNSTSVTDTPGSLSSLFSSLALTIPTTVPNVLLPTPTFSTSSYTFDTLATPAPTIGQTLPAQIDGGNSTYSTLFRQTGSGLAKLVNVTALPMLDAPSSVQTMTVTDSLGSVHTIISTTSQIPTDILGRPPGSFSVSGGVRTLRTPFQLFLPCLFALLHCYGSI